ncbi:hypothetical protein [Methanocalculus sp. MC3]
MNKSFEVRGEADQALIDTKTSEEGFSGIQFRDEPPPKRDHPHRRALLEAAANIFAYGILIGALTQFGIDLMSRV